MIVMILLLVLAVVRSAEISFLDAILRIVNSGSFPAGLDHFPTEEYWTYAELLTQAYIAFQGQTTSSKIKPHNVFFDSPVAVVKDTDSKFVRVTHIDKNEVTWSAVYFFYKKILSVIALKGNEVKSAGGRLIAPDSLLRKGIFDFLNHSPSERMFDHFNQKEPLGTDMKNAITLTAFGLKHGKIRHQRVRPTTDQQSK